MYRMLRAMLASVAAAVAVMAFATNAYAIEMTNEATGASCGTVVVATHGSGFGGCPLRFSSVGTVEFGGPFSMIFCTLNLEGRLAGGAGYVYGQTLTGCSPTTVTPCSEAAGNDVWDFRVTSETQARLTFCVNIPVFGAVTCTLIGLQLTELLEHRYRIATTGHQACSGAPFFTFMGDWLQVVDAAHPAVEFHD